MCAHEIDHRTCLEPFANTRCVHPEQRSRGIAHEGFEARERSAPGRKRLDELAPASAGGRERDESASQTRRALVRDPQCAVHTLPRVMLFSDRRALLPTAC